MAGPLSPEMIEKLRRGFPLQLDALGRLRFEGDEITHPKVVALFREGFDVNEAGDAIVRVADQWTYLNPVDCPYRVLSVLGEAPQLPTLRLDDGRELDLDPTRIAEDEGGGLRVAVPTRSGRGRLWARLTNKATMALSDWLELSDDEAVLCIAGQRYRIEQAQSFSGGLKSA